jgi:hypothetical protein
VNLQEVLAREIAHAPSGPKTADNFKHMSFDELRNVNETFGGFNGDLSHVSEEDEDYKEFFP